MNRLERRKLQKQGKTVPKEPTINIKASDLSQIKEESTTKAINIAFILMLGIPVMVMHDKYSQLMKREVDGKLRTERFADLCLDLYDSFDKGYLTLEDIHQCLWEEGGIKLIDRRGERK